MPGALFALAGLRGPAPRRTSSCASWPATRRTRSRSAAAHARAPATFEALRSAILELAKEGIQLSRFKGLGEMNPEQLWETTMDPETRTLQRVTMDDAQAADEIFTMLMGDKVEPRRDFIEQHARDVKFLDT